MRGWSGGVAPGGTRRQVRPCTLVGGVHAADSPARGYPTGPSMQRGDFVGRPHVADAGFTYAFDAGKSGLRGGPICHGTMASHRRHAARAMRWAKGGSSRDGGMNMVTSSTLAVARLAIRMRGRLETSNGAPATKAIHQAIHAAACRPLAWPSMSVG